MSRRRDEADPMIKVIADVTMSLDGFVTDDSAPLERQRSKRSRFASRR